MAGCRGSAPARREWVDLYALNERIVGAETDPYRVALAVEQYLRTDHDYSLRPPSAGYDSPYAEFLFATRTGYCQHFAGAMAALLRFNGIPARVVVGFTAGEQERNGVWAVTRNDAHSWVEVYFPGVGWAPFDPTPGRRIPSTGDAPANGPDATAAAGIDGAGASPAPSSEAREAGAARVSDPGGSGGQTAQTAPAETPGWLPWALGLPRGPRRLARQPRAAAPARPVHGPMEERLGASVWLLYADLRDHGVELPPSRTLDETARLPERAAGRGREMMKITSRPRRLFGRLVEAMPQRISDGFGFLSESDDGDGTDLYNGILCGLETLSSKKRRSSMIC